MLGKSELLDRAHGTKELTYRGKCSPQLLCIMHNTDGLLYIILQVLPLDIYTVIVDLDLGYPDLHSGQGRRERRHWYA